MSLLTLTANHGVSFVDELEGRIDPATVHMREYLVRTSEPVPNGKSLVYVERKRMHFREAPVASPCALGWGQHASSLQITAMLRAHTR